MAWLSAAESPVLSYGPRAHINPGGWKERLWLFWPAWAYRVIAPEQREKSVNALQRAVLAILRASRLTAGEMAERLGVHPELVGFVVTELQGRGYIDAGARLTDRGRTLLMEEEEAAANLVTGWVFRDPWNMSLWPFLARTLQMARTDLNDAGFPVLELGTTGKPWRQRAWIQSPLNDASSQVPEPREIIDASRRGRRLGRRAKSVGIWEEERQQSGEDFANLDRVNTIEPVPEHVYLVTFLYVPKDGPEKDLDWHVCDFFGRGSSPALRRLIAKVADSDTGLADEFDRFLRPTIYGGYASFQQAVARSRDDARQLLEHCMTIDIRRFGVQAPLAEALEAYVEIKALGDQAGDWRSRTALNACRRALERLFREIAQMFPLTGLYKQYSREDKALNASRLQAAASELGISEVPSALLNVTWGQLRAVTDYDNSWRLRPLVVATLLAARDKTDHPLWLASKADPTILTRIDAIASMSGEAAHDVIAQPGTSSLDELQAVLQSVLNITGVLLGLPAKSILEPRTNE